MSFPWRTALGVALLMAPALAISQWPTRTAPATAAAGPHAEHGDHSPQAVVHSQIGRTAVPAGVGATAWDGKLPPWPVGGRVIEVGQGKQYKTIGSALALAKDGDHLIIYGGHYHGFIKLDKAIWIEGRDNPDLMGHEGTVMLITGKGARVTGMTIYHSGDLVDQEDAGIQIKDAADVVVAGNTLTDVKFGIVAKNSQRVLIAGNNITGRDEEVSLVGDGIRAWYSDGAQILANTVRHAREIIVEQSKGAAVAHNAVVDSRQGLHLMSAPEATVTGNFLGSNSTGIYVMYGADTHIYGNWIADNRGPSGYGVGVKEADGARVEGNWLIGNRVGLYLENTPRTPERFNVIAGNLVAYNDQGVALTTSTNGNRISGNDFLENVQQVSASSQGAMASNAWTVDGTGNYWSDYEGYDENRDHVGDVAYAPVRVFEGWMDRQPQLRWFLFTSAASAVDTAARAFPIAAPDPILNDERPGMAPADRRELPWSSYSK